MSSDINFSVINPNKFLSFHKFDSLITISTRTKETQILKSVLEVKTYEFLLDYEYFKLHKDPMT